MLNSQYFRLNGVEQLASRRVSQQIQQIQFWLQLLLLLYIVLQQRMQVTAAVGAASMMSP